MTPWMILEGIMLNKTICTEKDKHYLILFIYGILKKKKVKSILIETESRKVVARGWLGGSGGEGNKGRLVKGYKLL